jgi:haloalkane dehalogenase
VAAADVYRAPDERFEGLPGYPFGPHWLDLDGLRMHYVDEGDGDPVLLLHGNPTWSFLYRKAIPPLAAAHRVVAPDYLGFGRSDKPLERDAYTYERHVASIARLVEELDLRDLTIVVQDWGGPIGMRVALDHADRVRGLVVMNTGVGGGRAPSDTWLRFREVVRELGGAVEISRLVQSGSATELSDDVLRGYDAPFPTPESKVGVQMFVEHVPTEPEHPNTPSLLAVRDEISRWRKPTLVLFGDSDPIFAPRVAESIAALIPGAGPAELVAGAGHFLQEDRGEEVGERIASWLATVSECSR